MTLLTILQRAAEECGSLNSPTQGFGNTDPLVVNLIALATREGRSQAARYQWQALRNTATFTSVATEIQGAIETIAPGYKYIINNTMWDRTQRRKIKGNLPPQKFQMLKAALVTGPYSQYSIFGGNIHFIPVPSAGNTIAFEYMSKYWCTSADGLTSRDAWADDDDVALLDEDLFVLGIKWRFLRSRGLDYAEEFAEYGERVADAASRDAAPGVLQFGAGAPVLSNPYIPEGDWNI